MSDDQFTREVGEKLQILLANKMTLMLNSDECTPSVLREVREFLKNVGVDTPVVRVEETLRANNELQDALEGFEASNVTRLKK